MASVNITLRDPPIEDVGCVRTGGSELGREVSCEGVDAVIGTGGIT